MKKHLLLNLLPVLMTFQSHASEEATLLKELLPDACVNSSQFTQTKTLAAIPNPIISKGQMFFSCELGLIWQTETPFTDILVYSNKNIQMKSTNGEEFDVLNNLAHSYLSKLLNNLLKADTDALAEDFYISAINATDKKAVALKPKSAQIAKNISDITIAREQSNPEANILITINNSNNQPLSLELHDHQYFDSSNTRENCGKTIAREKVCDALLNAERYRNESNL